MLASGDAVAFRVTRPDMWPTMETSWYQEAKLFLASTMGLSQDALHLYVGLGVFFLASLLRRKPLASLLPPPRPSCIPQPAHR